MFSDSSKNHWLVVTITYLKTVSIFDDIVIPNISIFPHPTNNSYIFIEGLENEEIRLFDVNGNFINSFFISENPYKLDISNRSVGTYYITNKNNQLLGRFIKGEK